MGDYKSNWEELNLPSMPLTIVKLIILYLLLQTIYLIIE